MFELMVESTFDSAHCLRGYEGPCEALHGHTYKVQAFYRGDKLNELGMLVDFKRLKGSVAEATQDLDHRYLNDIPEFADVNPTAENIAKLIFLRLRKALGVGIHKVTVWETFTSSATYWEE